MFMCSVLKTGSDLGRKIFSFCTEVWNPALEQSSTTNCFGRVNQMEEVTALGYQSAQLGSSVREISFSLHNIILQAGRTKGMCCSTLLPSLSTCCLLNPSNCSFNITLIKEVLDRLREEKWGGLPWASGAMMMCRPTMDLVFFQLMIKYLAHKYQYYIIPKSSQQILTICETLFGKIWVFQSQSVEQNRLLIKNWWEQQ